MEKMTASRAELRDEVVVARLTEAPQAEQKALPADEIETMAKARLAAPRAELRLPAGRQGSIPEARVRSETTLSEVRDTGLILEEAFTQGRALVAGVAPYLRMPEVLPVYHVASTPEELAHMGSHVAYFDKDKKEIVINGEKIQDLPEAEALADLTVAFVHELVHAAGGDEIAAYDAQAKVMKRLDAESVAAGLPVRYGWQTDLIDALLAAARGEIKTGDESMRRDVIQLAEQVLIAKGDRAQIFEALLNRLQSQVYSIGDENFSVEQGMKTIRDAADLKTRMSLFVSDAVSSEHTVFLVPADAVPEIRGMLDQLAARGYGIFIYTRGSKVAPVRWTAELCAQFGKGQFIEAFGEKKDPSTGYLSMENYITDKLVRYLLSEILAQQSVAQAA